MRLLVVIAYHNGSKFLPTLLNSLDSTYPVLVVDTGSTVEEQVVLERAPMRGYIAGGFCVAAYEYAYRHHPHYDAYLFLHDSMRAKVSDAPDYFIGNGEVVAWIGFGMSFDKGVQEAYLRRYYGDLTNTPATAIFGPIFYATRQAMETLDAKNLLPPHPTNRDELCASERGYAIAFHRAGIAIEHLEEYDNERIDVRRDYRLFDKYRPNRP